MRFALRGSFTKLVIACICVGGFRLQSSPNLIHAQSAPASASAPAATKPGDDPPFKVVSYKADQGLLHAVMELQSSPTSSGLVFSIRQDGGGPPSLEDQARVIDLLLQRLVHDHPDLTHLGVMFGGQREAFIPLLDTYLLRSPLWNSRTGRPKRGKLEPFLDGAIRSQGMLVGLQKVFQKNGFSFTLDGVNRIDIEKVPAMQGALLPVHIDAMYFRAEKASKPEVNR